MDQIIMSPLQELLVLLSDYILSVSNFITPFSLPVKGGGLSVDISERIYKSELLSYKRFSTTWKIISPVVVPFKSNLTFLQLYESILIYSTNEYYKLSCV